MNISIVIPLFNEKKHIKDVLKSVAKLGFSVIVVDDGSKDDSGASVDNSRLKNVVLLTHKVNLGKGAAMKTGAEYAFSHGADAIIFMDSDAQHSVGDIEKFTKTLQKGDCDVIFGSRNLNFGVPLARYMGNKSASLLVRVLFGVYVSDLLCGFRALTKKAYGKIKWESTGYGVETEMVIRTAKARLSYCEVPVETIYHDKVKGVTPLDAFGILLNILEWRLRI